MRGLRPRSGPQVSSIPLGVLTVPPELRAFLTGLAIFLVLTLGYFLLIAGVRSDNQLLGWFALAIEFSASLLAGFVCGRFVQRRQFATLLVLGVASALSLGVLNYLWGALGFPSDLGGLGNLPVVIGLSLLTVVPLVVVGGAVGAKLQHGTHA
jgi:hypothetical protein